MINRKTTALSLLLLSLALGSLAAGDTASFVDLGFSPDGGTYMFGQYGIRNGTLKPWAELFAVDMGRNVFIQGGRLAYTHDAPAVSGQDGSGAFLHLLTQNATLAERRGVNYLTRGRLLYVGVLDGVERETIEFRDFEKGASYRATLVTRTEGTGANLRSSFVIELEQTGANGARRSFQGGSPQVKRSLISSYQIRRVMISPRDGGLIFVIETRGQAASGQDIRYMVEAVKF
jgi:predicted secreted protein